MGTVAASAAAMFSVPSSAWCGFTVTGKSWVNENILTRYQRQYPAIFGK